MSPGNDTWWKRKRTMLLVVGIPLIVLILGSLAAIWVGRSISEKINSSQQQIQQIIRTSPVLANNDSIAFASVRAHLRVCGTFGDTVNPKLDSLERLSDTLKAKFYYAILCIRNALDTVKDGKGKNAPHLVDSVLMGSGLSTVIREKLMDYLRQQNELRKLLKRQPYSQRPRDDFELSSGPTDEWEKNNLGGLLAEDAMRKIDLYILAVTERNRDLLARIRSECADR